MSTKVETKNIEIMENFTEVFRKYRKKSKIIREIECLKVQFPAIFSPIQENDLFAGRINELLPIGFFPQELALGFYCDNQVLDDYLNAEQISEEEKLRLQELKNFWQKNTTSYKVRQAYPDDLAQALPSDEWMDEPGIAFPLYRMSGSHPDYEKLINLGIPGLKSEIEQRREKARKNNEDTEFLEGLLAVLDILTQSCQYYATMAKKQSRQTVNAKRVNQLIEIEEVLTAISTGKPQTFQQAIQLMWMYALLTGSFNYGRMDVYLGNFLANDIKQGNLDQEKALELLSSLWQLIIDRKTTFDGRVIVGGMGRPNEENADKFALLAMETTRRIPDILPQLTLRFYKGQNPALMKKALDVIGQGRTYPMLYNDDVNVPSVKSAFDVNEQEAECYLPFGCGEYVLNHRSYGTPSGVINLLKALEITLHNGKDPLTGNNGGLALGEFSDFDNFDDLFDAYKQQVEYFVKYLAIQEKIEYDITAEESPFLFLSLLFDDCIENNKPIFEGGIRYLGGTLETYGNSSTADSLTAIKKLVYDKKILSQEQLLDILDKNFEGYEKERKLMLDVPKYGNDLEIADKMAQEVHDHVCHVTRKQRENTGLHSYLVVNINNHANTILGRHTAASADGRSSNSPMSNANNPTSGMDKNGVTAMLNSLVKLDTKYHAGAVQNMKFSKEMFTQQRDKLKALLETYFDNGGAQAMLTVVGREDLENAMKNPEEYANLIVRVGGFSARFVELDRDVQEEILSRTLY